MRPISLLLAMVLAVSLTHAQSITLAPPTSSTTYVDQLSVSYSITGDASAQSVYITFTYTSGNNKDSIGKQYVLNLKTPSLSQTFTLKPTDLGNSANAFTCATATSMPEGFYTVFATYKRPVSAGSLLVTTTNRTNVYLDLVTMPPVITLPLPSATVRTSFQFIDSLPEFYLSGSKILKFDGPATTTINMTDNTKKDTLLLNPNLLASSAFTSKTGVDSLPDGTYTMTLSYQDRFSHPTSSVVRTITIDRSTIAPTILAPAASSTTGSVLTTQFVVPENVSSGTVKLIVSDGMGYTNMISTSIAGAGIYSFALNTLNLSASAGITAATSNSIPAGIYQLSVAYQDAVGNPVAMASVSNITIDNSTQVATLSSPSNGITVKAGTALPIAYSLPEAALAGSVRLNITNANYGCSIQLSNAQQGNGSVTLNTGNISLSPGVVSSACNSIPNGSYLLTLSYMDALSNPAVSSSPVSFNIDGITAPPVLQLPGDSTTSVQTMNVSFDLPEPALNNQATVQFLGCSNVTLQLATSGTGTQAYALNGRNLAATSNLVSSSSATLPTGSYTMLVTYQDTTGNPKAYAIQTDVSISGTLPMTLNRLNGNILLSQTHLNWETMVESNSLRFDVEFSSDGNRFTTIGKVNAKGNSSTRSNYSFVHNNPLPGKNYYRLKMLNVDLSFAYSNVIALINGRLTESFSVYPNPSGYHATMSIVSARSASQDYVQFFDANGKQVKTITVTVAPGTNLIPVDLSTLSAGQYFIQHHGSVIKLSKR